MSVADDLKAARALIDTEEKWLQGRYRDRKGRLCAIGAVQDAVGLDYERVGDCRKALGAALPVGKQTLNAALYNDDPNTTHADVLALFDRAIAAESSR